MIYKMEKMMSKQIGKIIIAICIAFLLWLSFSFVEVIAKNNLENPNYSNINAFEILFENFL